MFTCFLILVFESTPSCLEHDELICLEFYWPSVASVAFFLLLQPLEKSVKKSSSEDHNGAAMSVSEPKAGNSWFAAAELGWWTFLGTALQVFPHRRPLCFIWRFDAVYNSQF